MKKFTAIISNSNNWFDETTAEIRKEIEKISSGVDIKTIIKNRVSYEK